jgi:hypothetical protein
MSTTDKLLMTAILSMDAYSQGYNRGVFLGAADKPVNIGDATFVRKSDSNPSTANGFYAQSFLWNGKIIVAYRGTDNTDLWGKDPQKGISDIWSGWTIGAGAPAGQAASAISFLKDATGDIASGPTDPNVILTGHSLGGGLAGLITQAASVLREGIAVGTAYFTDLVFGGDCLGRLQCLS